MFWSYDSIDFKFIRPIVNVWWDTEFWSHAAIGLATCCSDRTTGRANDLTITELLVGSCISRHRSCNQSAQVVRRYMFSHSEVLRDVARPIVRGYNQLYDKAHHIWQSSVHDRWYNHEWVMVRPICDWCYDLFTSQNRRWEVLNMSKNLAETDFASTIVHDLSDKSCAVSAI